MLCMYQMEMNQLDVKEIKNKQRYIYKVHLALFFTVLNSLSLYGLSRFSHFLSRQEEHTARYQRTNIRCQKSGADKSQPHPVKHRI